MEFPFQSVYPVHINIICVNIPGWTTNTTNGCSICNPSFSSPYTTQPIFQITLWCIWIRQPWCGTRRWQMICWSQSHFHIRGIDVSMPLIVINAHLELRIRYNIFKVTSNFKTFCFTFEFKHNRMSLIKIRIRYVSYLQS